MSFSGLESPLQSFARRHNFTSTYQHAVGEAGPSSTPIRESTGEEPVRPNRLETLRQLEEELNFVTKQAELESLQVAIDSEKHALANRSVQLRDREASVLEAQRALEAQQAALRLELAALEAEQLRAVDEQRRLDMAADSLHNKQLQLEEELARRSEGKSRSHTEAKAYVDAAQDGNPFNALNEALRCYAPVGVLRAIIENHIGGVDQQNVRYNMWTPLHYAAWHGHDALCQLLVAHNANVNAQDTYSHYTPLDWAVSRHHDDAATYLLSVGGKRGVAIKRESALGNAPLTIRGGSSAVM